MTCHLKYGIPSSEIPFVYCRPIAIISQFTYKEDNIRLILDTCQVLANSDENYFWGVVQNFVQIKTISE